MDSYEQFYAQAKIAAEKFKALDKNKTIRLISHLDADGISAAALFIKLLNLENMAYSVSIVQQLNREVLIDLAKESYQYVVFTDIGCGILSGIGELLSDKTVFIFDHHTPEQIENLPKNAMILNPHYATIDGGKEVSGAGVVYYFAKEVNAQMEDMAHIALVGALGDVQDDGGFLKLNNQIVETAIRKKKIAVKRGLRLFGAFTKPLHKSLEYSTDPYIPGVTGSESGAIQFLAQLGIEPKVGSKWKKVSTLSEAEMKKLVTGIIMRRLGESRPEDVLGNMYVLQNEPDESPTKEAKEFATLLNACGRMGKASYGIGACLGDKTLTELAISNLNEYKKEIINAINWYHDNRKSNFVIEKPGYVIINAQDKIRSTMVGTLASIMSKSNWLESGTYILSMARTPEKTTKVSLRMSGRNESADLRDVLKKVTASIENCEAGGHHNAAGAVIPSHTEYDLIEAAKEYLGKIALEEEIK